MICTSAAARRFRGEYGHNPEVGCLGGRVVKNDWLQSAFQALRPPLFLSVLA
jgi:hypothetical protein